MPRSSGTLSEGTSGSPRQVRKGEPNRLTGGWRHAAPCALAPERRDRRGVREEEGRLLPYPRDQLVEIVGGRRAGTCRDASSTARRWQ